MNYKLLTYLLITSFMATPALAKPVCFNKVLTVGVIDTGFGYLQKGKGANLCKYGHRDFTNDGQFTTMYGTKDSVPIDLDGHGTNIVGTIDNYAQRSGISYCLVVIKFYSKKGTNRENVERSEKAFKYALNIGVNIINYSGGGDAGTNKEREYVKEFLDIGGRMIAAAGNNGTLLGKEGLFYPAMYDARIDVVGNLNQDGTRSPTSNYGPYVNRWEIGEDVDAYGIVMTGTSQAAATFTGKLIKNKYRSCDR